MRTSLNFAMCAALLGLFVSSPVFAQQKSVKACQREWRANKAENRAKGITEKAYVADCRAGTNAAKPTTAPSTAPAGTNKFPTEAQAKARCPSDTIVWVDLSYLIYHYAGYHNYGKTKKGAYMCEKDAMSAGSHVSKHEKRP